VAIVWGALVVFLCGLIVAKALVGTGPSVPTAGLPDYGKIPDFELLESTGEPFSISDLEGKVWVASLFFTHCAASCPMMASQLAKFQASVDNPDIVLVSISVDPERDTPERLREYAKLTGAKPGRWYFLTGETDTIVELAEEHLKLGTGQAKEDFSTPQDLGLDLTESEGAIENLIESAASEVVEGASPEDAWEDSWEIDTDVSVPGAGAADVQNPILHSDRFALIDGQGRIRGYYDGLNEKEVEQLRADAEKLVSHRPR
jgi:cytochrome oxidase Cu insertion factor (SCO1/SenC/PrrC family)